MQKKIFFQFVLIIVIPSALIFFFSNSYYVSRSIDRQIESDNRLIEELRKNLDTKLNYYRQMTIQFYLNEEAMGQILDETDILNCRSISSQLSSFVNANRLISSAHLYTGKGSVYSGMGMIGTDEVNRDLQDTLNTLNGKIYWGPTRRMKSFFGIRQFFFFGSRQIRKNDTPIATLHLGFGELFWEDFFEHIPFSGDQLIIVCDELGTVIAANDMSLTGTVIYNRKVMNAILNQKTIIQDTSGDDRIILASRSRESGWYISLLLFPDSISRDLAAVRNFFYLSVPLYLAFFFYLSFVLSKSLTRPLDELAAALNKVGGGTLDIRVNENQIDEVKQLSRSFNIMTRRIQSLLEKVKIEEEEKQRATMHALQLQLTPHFLYNSLNTIRWMAQINGQSHIRELTRSLISFLKEVSNTGSEFHSITKELRLLQDYATIQKFRYRHFHLVIDAPEETGNYCVNKMILVNLMENSIIHGFHEKEDEGEIAVSVKLDGKRLYIDFSDNGIGFDPDGWDTSNPDSDNHAHVHTGLKNIKQRLQLYHNSDYEMRVSSSVGNGCSIHIGLPLIECPLPEPLHKEQ